jgi:hypothetical protein
VLWLKNTNIIQEIQRSGRGTQTKCRIGSVVAEEHEDYSG